jgi:hypothetical protein
MVTTELNHQHLMPARLNHVMSLAKGGKHEAVNAQPAHSKCNVSDKGNAVNYRLPLFGLLSQKVATGEGDSDQPKQKTASEGFGQRRS